MSQQKYCLGVHQVGETPLNGSCYSSANSVLDKMQDKPQAKHNTEIKFSLKWPS